MYYVSKKIEVPSRIRQHPQWRLSLQQQKIIGVR